MNIGNVNIALDKASSYPKIAGMEYECLKVRPLEPGVEDR